MVFGAPSFPLISFTAAFLICCGSILNLILVFPLQLLPIPAIVIVAVPA